MLDDFQRFGSFFAIGSPALELIRIKKSEILRNKAIKEFSHFFVDYDNAT